MQPLEELALLREYAERNSEDAFAELVSRRVAEDVAAGDITAGEDLVVRQAAIDALGNMNGTVVAIEPTSGRVRQIYERICLPTSENVVATSSGDNSSMALVAWESKIKMLTTRLVS